MTIEATLDRIAAALERLADAKSSATPAATPDAPKASRGRPKKEAETPTQPEAPKAEQAKAEPAQAEAPKAEPVQAQPAPAAAAAEPPFEYDVLKAEVLRLANKGAEGRERTAALLKEFGAAKAIDVPVERWNELLGRFQKEIAELDGAGDFA